jgi:hypothetical protein
VRPRAGLNAVVKRKVSAFARTPGCPARSVVTILSELPPFLLSEPKTRLLIRSTVILSFHLRLGISRDSSVV